MIDNLPAWVRDKPDFPLHELYLTMFQQQNVLLQEVLQKLNSMENIMKKAEKTEKAPVKGKGKMKKCPNCGKPYAGDKCPCSATPKGKAKMMGY